MSRLGLGALLFMALGACGGETGGGSGNAAGTGATAGDGGGAVGGSGAMGGSGGGGGFGGCTTGGPSDPCGPDRPCCSGSCLGGGCEGGAGNMGNTGGASCAALAGAYKSTLHMAKYCDPLAEANECTTPVMDQLPCPCAPTYVNPGNGLMNALQDLADQWKAAQCTAPFACPEMACETPTAGECQPGDAGGSGSCGDVFLGGG